MKTAFIIFILGFSMGLKSCDNHEVVEGTPKCIVQEIENEEGYCLARVVKYTYNDNVVYLFELGLCMDEFWYLYDEDCNVICAPCGGLDGQGDGNCSDFYQISIEEEVVWTLKE